MKILKRAAAMFLAVCLLMGLEAISALAAEELKVGDRFTDKSTGLRYEISRVGYYPGPMANIVDYTGDSSSVTITPTVQYNGETVTVRQIDYLSMASTTLTHVTFAEGTETLIRSSTVGIFAGATALESVTLPSGLTEIPTSMFSGCTSLTSFEIPSSVTEIGNSAFAGSGLRSITIPSTVKSLGALAFSDCSYITSADIEPGITRIEAGLFQDCPSLTSVNIPDGVTYIGGHAFGGCTGLSTMTLPASIQEIGLGAFSRCTNLKSVTFLGSNLSGLDIYGAGEQYNPDKGIPPETVLYVQPGATGYEHLQSTYMVLEVGQSMPELSLSASPASVDLGTLTIGSTNVTRQVTITNTGSVDMTYVDYDYSGDTYGYGSSARPAAYLRAEEKTIAPGESMAVTVYPNSDSYFEFDTKAHSCTFTLNFVSPQNLTRTVSINLNFAVTDRVGLTLSPTSLDFGSVKEGYTKAPDYQEVKVTNTGSDRIEFVAPTSQYYNITSVDTDLNPEGFDYIYVTPKKDLEAGDYSEDIAFKSTSGETLATLHVAFTVTSEVGLEISPSSLDFGSASEGYSQQTTKSVTVRNTGTEDLNFKMGNSSYYDFVTFPSAIPAGSSVTLSLRPKANLSAGTYNETITIRSTDGRASGTLSVKFTVTSGGLEISPSSVNFGTLNEGYSAPSSRSVSIKNTGTGTLSLRRPTFTSFELTSFPSTISAGSSASFSIRPKTGLKPGSYRENVTIESTDGKAKGSFTVSFTVKGDELYSDVSSSSWYYEAVKYVTDAGLMEGMDGGKFNPTGTATRAQVVTILYRLAGEPAVSGSTPFEDVSTSNWFYAQVKWASDNNIVNGVSDTTFSPNSPVTREQLAAMLHRYAAYRNYNLSGGAGLTGYADDDSVSSYAVEAMEWANGRGIITGTDGNRLDPKGNANRAQLATILQRFNENIVK